MLRKTFFIIAMCLVGLSVWSMGVGNKVRVGVFQGNGGAQTCIWETIASIQLDPEMTVRTRDSRYLVGIGIYFGKPKKKETFIYNSS